MSERIFCPLSFNLKENNGGTCECLGFLDYTNKDGEKAVCAWWNKEKKECAVLSMTKKPFYI